jgi:hypothetical protein
MAKRRTLKSRLHKYFSRKDICCENEFDRTVAIQQIIDKYKKIAQKLNIKDEPYISYINNDLLIFIGYKYNLQENKDVPGIKLWDELNQRMYTNKTLDEQKIVRLLREIPLYYLLSFLGYATYKEAFYTKKLN